MRVNLLRGAAALGFFSPLGAESATPRWLEALDRGAVAVPAKDGGNLVSWRLLATDAPQSVFDVYRDGQKLNARALDRGTNFIDATGTAQSAYVIRTRVHGRDVETSEPVPVWANGFLSVPIQQPAGGVTPSGETYTYTAHDSSAGDLDGDGRYEIILKWEPSNLKDNAFGGYTGEVYIDAYTLAGRRLWRINLGKNIRAGAHYTQFQVYDYDGDGRAEMAVRTSDGTIDGAGRILGDPAADWRETGGEMPTADRTGSVVKADGRKVAPMQGRIIKGPEFLTIFDGLTGQALASEPYWPARDPRTDAPTPEQMTETWDDGYANRSDRFLAGTAYLDGQRPSILMARGYYARSTLAAWDWRDGKLTRRWTFDSDTQAAPAKWRGQGNHSLSVADIDADGRDEIIYGAMAIDDHGAGFWSTELRHGDALHVGDFDLSNPGLESFGVLEQPSKNGGKITSMTDAATGKLLWTVTGDKDNGRGIIMDIDPRHPGAESWSSVDAHLRDAKGESIGTVKPQSNKFAIWWDGDLLREQMEHPVIHKWDWLAQRSDRLLTAEGAAAKGAPSLSADLLGDWREEVVWAAADNQSLRIYTTPHATEHRLVTLMHDAQYRVAIAWQNTAYNQPPHPSYYLGHDMKTPPTPGIIPRKFIPTPTTTAASAAPAGFLFATFEGEFTPMGEQIHFGLSADGRNWSALNQSRPVLVSELGEKGVRDPFLLRAHDGKVFYLIATDLSIHLKPDWKRAVRAGSRSIVIWESTDLVNWSAPRLVKIAPDDAGCTWAPEAIYDAEAGDYLVFWASTTAGDDFKKFRIWAARTKDFRSFGAPFIYIEKPTTIIDTTIVHDGDRYHRFTKDEKHKAITMETSARLDGPWSDVAGFSLAKLVGYEGPACYLIEPAREGRPPVWGLILDHYTQKGGYRPWITHNLASGVFEEAQGFSFPFKFRHGSVLPLTADEYARLTRGTIFPR